jgi:hypothetical protein
MLGAKLFQDYENATTPQEYDFARRKLLLWIIEQDRKPQEESTDFQQFQQFP